MIIEFAGASGSGKTTVAAAVLSAATGVIPGRRSVPGGDLRSRAALIIGSLAGLVALPGMLFRLSRRSSDELEALWVAASLEKRLRILFLACRSRAQSRSARTWLNDQGLVQALAYLTRSWPEGRQHTLIAELYDRLGRQTVPDLLIVFSVAPRLTSSRTKLQGARHQDGDEIARTVASFTTHAAVLRQNFGVRVATLTNDGELSMAVREAMAAIQPPVPPSSTVKTHP
jgi:hypothetical protein